MNSLLATSVTEHRPMTNGLDWWLNGPLVHPTPVMVKELMTMIDVMMMGIMMMMIMATIRLVMMMTRRKKNMMMTIASI